MNMPNGELSLNQKKRIAVAYLIQNKEERPNGLEKFFKKLEEYEQSIIEIVSAGKEAEKALQELGVKREQLFGSINSIVEMVADELPNDKSEEWASKYKPHTEDPSMAGGTRLKKAEPVDMAGSTSKQAAPEIISSVAKKEQTPTM